MARDILMNGALIAEDGCRCSAGCLAPISWVAVHPTKVNSVVMKPCVKENWITPNQRFISEVSAEITKAKRGSIKFNTAVMAYHGIELTKQNLQLLCDLEIVHEDHPVTEWESELDKIALKYNLCDYMISPKDTVRLPKKNATLGELTGTVVK